MQRFLDGEVCVFVNEQQAKELLEQCEELGLMWQGGQVATDTDGWMYFDVRKVTIGRAGVGHSLLYSSQGHNLPGMKGIEYEELLPLQPKVKPIPLDLSFLTE